VLFVELLGRSNGIGYQIEYYYQLFDLGRVLEYTVFFVAVMLLIEVVILGTIEKRLFRWRPATRIA
jgi:NitT/TauT family transport system permease protein